MKQIASLFVKSTGLDPRPHKYSIACVVLASFICGGGLGCGSKPDASSASSQQPTAENSQSPVREFVPAELGQMPASVRELWIGMPEEEVKRLFPLITEDYWSAGGTHQAAIEDSEGSVHFCIAQGKLESARFFAGIDYDAFLRVEGWMTFAPK